MYRDARKQAGFSREEAAFRLHLGTRTLAYYEAGERLPGPDVVLKMCREYKQPDLTLRYCRECCPIGQVYSYEILNNIDMSLAAILTKLRSEMMEAMVAIDVLQDLSINKRYKADFREEEWLDFTDAIQEFIDIEHNVEILKVALEGLTEEPTLIQELVNKHNQKCWNKGYVKKEKAPAFAAAR